MTIDLIMQLQDLLTNMVLFSGGKELYTELFEAAVKCLGHIRRVNFRYKQSSNAQIEAKDFVNSPVSQTIDFAGPVR